MTYKSFLSLFFVLILVKGVFSNCYTNPDNFCQATCQWNDGTNVSLDISAIVTYPYTVSGVFSDDNFQFIFTLCKGAVCDDATNAAICQHESNGKAYSCGIVETAIWSLISISPYKFTITYAGGACIAPEECKKGRLVFEEITDDSTTSELSLQLSNVIASTYVFNITGKCIGQPNCGADEINYVGPIGLVLIILYAIIYIYLYDTCVST
jgi:hypothetical protein